MSGQGLALCLQRGKLSGATCYPPYVYLTGTMGGPLDRGALSTSGNTSAVCLLSPSDHAPQPQVASGLGVYGPGSSPPANGTHPRPAFVQRAPLATRVQTVTSRHTERKKPAERGVVDSQATGDEAESTRVSHKKGWGPVRCVVSSEGTREAHAAGATRAHHPASSSRHPAMEADGGVSPQRRTFKEKLLHSLSEAEAEDAARQQSVVKPPLNFKDPIDTLLRPLLNCKDPN